MTESLKHLVPGTRFNEARRRMLKTVLVAQLFPVIGIVIAELLVHPLILLALLVLPVPLMLIGWVMSKWKVVQLLDDGFEVGGQNVPFTSVMSIAAYPQHIEIAYQTNGVNAAVLLGGPLFEGGIKPEVLSELKQLCSHLVTAGPGATATSEDS